MMSSSRRLILKPLLVVLFGLMAFSASLWLSIKVLEGLPHIEDEMAYDWQARVIARGHLTLPTPQPCSGCFLVPFVVDYNGMRFGKYPPGWPAVLALGHLQVWKSLPYARNMINPILAGGSIWLIYLLAKKLLDERTAVLTAFLTTLSPFFLMNSALLLSHSLSFFLTLCFCLGWLDTFTTPNPRLSPLVRHRLPLAVAALSMGLLALTRPMSAVAIALPFAIHGLYLLIKGSNQQRANLLIFGVTAGMVAGLVFVWQFAVTGDPLLNPYILWWPYDTIGFGPSVGRQPGGYMPVHGIANTIFSLQSGSSDFLGWPGISWIFMPFGLISILKNRRAWMVCAVLPALVAGYFLYWMSSSLVGPRYYYEGLFAAAFLSAAGLIWLADQASRVSKVFVKSPPSPWKGFAILNRIRSNPFASLLGLVVVVLIVYDLVIYMPPRFQKLRGLYGVSRTCYKPFETPAAREAVPALVIVPVENKWIEYGCMLDMTSPFFDSDFVLMVSHGVNIDTAVAKSMPDRNVLYYDPRSKRLVKAASTPQRE